jgi:hypothetical protein
VAPVQNQIGNGHLCSALAIVAGFVSGLLISPRTLRERQKKLIAA